MGVFDEDAHMGEKIDEYRKLKKENGICPGNALSQDTPVVGTHKTPFCLGCVYLGFLSLKIQIPTWWNNCLWEWENRSLCCRFLG